MTQLRDDITETIVILSRQLSKLYINNYNETSLNFAVYGQDFWKHIYNSMLVQDKLKLDMINLK